MSAGRLFQANQRPEQFLKRAILTSGSFEHIMNEREPRRGGSSSEEEWRQRKGKTDSCGPPEVALLSRSRLAAVLAGGGSSPTNDGPSDPPRPGPHHDLCLFQTKRFFVGQAPSPSSSSDGIDHALPQNTRRQRTAAHRVMHSGSRGPHRLPHQAPRLSCGPWVVTRSHLENE